MNNKIHIVSQKWGQKEKTALEVPLGNRRSSIKLKLRKDLKRSSLQTAKNSSNSHRRGNIVRRIQQEYIGNSKKRISRISPWMRWNTALFHGDHRWFSLHSKRENIIVRSFDESRRRYRAEIGKQFVGYIENIREEK